MFPNFEVNFLYEEQRHQDEIRQIQLENEYRRAFRNTSAAKRLNLAGLISRFGLLSARLSAILRGDSRGTPDSGASARVAVGTVDSCPEPCLAS
jgi:hypothetical protein